MSDEHKLATATEEAQAKSAPVSPTYVTYEQLAAMRAGSTTTLAEWNLGRGHADGDNSLTIKWDPK